VVEVALCGMPSSFLQQIVAPGATVATPGVNWFTATIRTKVSEGAHGSGCAVAGEPMRTAAAHDAHTAERAQSAFTVRTTACRRYRIPAEGTSESVPNLAW
jgi:hypothetical protein